MPLTGRLDADFSSFTTAVNQAVGDAARLQTAEAGVQQQQDRVTASVDKSVTSYAALGAEAPSDMDRLMAATRGVADETEQAVVHHNNLTDSLGQFDRLLSKVGVNLTSEIGALKEVESAAGKTTTELGALGTAGLAIGTAFASYDLTRKALEFLGLKEAVDSTAESFWRFVLRLDDPALVTAAAKQDAITNAIKAGAPETIKYADAVKYLTDKHTAAVAAQKAYDEGIAHLTIVGQNWQAVLAAMDPLVVDQSLRFLELGASAKDLAGAFKLNESQVAALASAHKALVDTTKAATAAQKDHEAALQAFDKLVADEHLTTLKMAWDHEKEWNKEREAATKAMNDTILAGFKQIQDAETKLAQMSMATTATTFDQRIQKIREWADHEIAAFKGTADQRAQYTEVIETQVLYLEQKEIDAENKVTAASTTGADTRVANHQRVAGAIGGEIDALDRLASLAERGPLGGAGGSLALPGFSSPEEMNAALTAFYDQFTGAAGGIGQMGGGIPMVGFGGGMNVGQPRSLLPGGGSISNTFNIVDTAENLARKVGDLLTRDVYRGTKVGGY
jgi:hypothetical protein